MSPDNPLSGLTIDDLGEQSKVRVRDWEGRISQCEKRVKQRAFLRAFACCGRVAEAAAIVGVRESTVYGWKKCKKYRKRFKRARRKYLEVLESEAHRRAVDGVERLKFFKGQPIVDPRTGEAYIEKEYSDQLLVKLLEANGPEKYRAKALNHRPESAVNVNVGIGVNNQIRVIQDDDWYGNANRLPSPADASHAEGVDQ